MNWLRRIMWPAIEEPRLYSGPSLPTVRFDPALVTPEVEQLIWELLADSIEANGRVLTAAHRVAVESVKRGGALHMTAMHLESIGLSRSDSSRIARHVQSAATAVISRKRQIKSGITTAKWLYGGAGCTRSGRSDDSADPDYHQNVAHKSASGRRYNVASGMILNGVRTWPGMERGCCCVSIPIIDALDQ